MSFRIGALALPLVALTAACTATPAGSTNPTDPTDGFVASEVHR